MPQSTNLNVNPYYSDFDENNNYYKVLFKPSVTVQTRELNNLQSILQNQIEKFGSKFFSKGGVVIPGNYAYDGQYHCVEVESTFAGISVETYFENLIGKTIKGKTTGINAKIEDVLSKDNSQSTRKTTAIYVKYKSSSTEDFSTNVFENGEELTIESDVIVGTTLFSSGTSVFRVLSPTDRLATSIGSAAKIEDGVYFVRGYFVNVSKETILLDPYSNTPSYRVGLNVLESIIDSSEDTNLVDNARGFSNYAAPGADRLKIELSLSKKSLDDYNDDNFIELFRVIDGNLKIIPQDDAGSFITETLARRTYDESGNYYVNPLQVEALESLNDNLGNGGLYTDTDKTSGGLVPSEDLAVLKVSPGKSYIKGYEITTSTELLDYPKPRTTKTVESSSSIFYAGNQIKVNNIKGIPNIGLTTNYSVSLYDSRLTNNVAAGTTIGVARVYDFEYDNESYANSASEANLYLFDIQTYTSINLSSSIAGLAVGNHLKGQYSNASGYVKSVSGTDVQLYQVSGSFIEDEPLVASGISTTTTISSLRDYSIQDIKSIANGSNFTCDSLLSNETLISGPFNLTVDAGIGTITRQDGNAFTYGIVVNDIVKYAQAGFTVPLYGRVTEVDVNNSSIKLSTVSNVGFVCNGTLGSSSSLENISVVRPEITNYNNSSLYSPLEKPNISEVSLLNSSIYVKRQYTGLTITSNSLTLPNLTNTNFVYAAFDEEKYALIDDSGNNIPISSSNFTLNSGAKTGTISGLSVSSASAAKLITTQIKSKISSKYKKLNRCSILTLTNSKYASPSFGLSNSTIYGRRVEDQEISLNVPDVFEVHAVLQSSTSSSPQLPELTISGLDTANVIIGEIFVGQTSGAVAICVAKPSSSSISFIYKSTNKFVSQETLKLKESETSAVVTAVTPGDQNILSDFIVDDGQRKHFYDFGRLVRKDSSKEPNSKLTIIFDYFSYEATDFGDVITVNSYPSNLYGSKIHTFESIRNTDAIDIRPRVTNYDTNTSFSPFDYTSRVFTTSSNNSTQVLKSNESIVFDYSFYLPRTDKLTLSKSGKFNLVLGESSENPTTPSISGELLDVATIQSSPYVYDINQDINISLSDHKRYTMSDLRDIEKRVENLEYYTSLSLLELSTKDLLITDSNGLNRFKSGFFVDNFSNYDTADIENIAFKSSILNNSLTPETQRAKVPLQISQATFPNLTVSDKSITLKYTESSYQNQPFASKFVNVNPFDIVDWSGKLQLNPSVDYWENPTFITRTSRSASHRTFTTVNRTVTGQASFIRERNIEFTSTRLKPFTQFDLIFDSRNFSNNATEKTTYAFPKLIEITNVIGTFQAGETVNGYDSNGNKISFRLCNSNHKSGTYNNPSSVYKVNPYNPSVGMPELYGPQSTTLNVDTASLQEESNTTFYGNITSGMKLYGVNSKANATVSQVRLVSDDNGVLIGSIFVKKDSFKTGSTTVKLVESSNLSSPSSAEATFTSKGEAVTVTTIHYSDPLSQTFLVEEPEGVFLTSIDIYFQSKHQNIPVTLQIREVTSGIPGGPDKIVGTLEKTLTPSEVNTSSNASVATNFKFDKPQRLEGGREYAIVLLSSSDGYNVWISRVGEVDISTASLPEVQKIIINKQPSAGSLFKSQNGTTWVPTPEEDLKFTIYKAKFSKNSGTAIFYNADSSVKSKDNVLPLNPITTLSSSASSPYNNGRYILVRHPNHGMYSLNNKVTISGVFPDVLPVKLAAEYLLTSTSDILIPAGQESLFTSFNGTPVEPGNPGYILIGEEIISYTGRSSGRLTGITRSQFGTVSVTHPVNSLIYKYEFSGVSLSRINTTFNSISAPTIDSYYVQIDDDTTFTSTKSGGGASVQATKNIQFSSLEFDNKFVEKYPSTSISASIRSVSSTSVNGSEVSFLDKGIDNIDINGVNEFDSIRMVCSTPNELTHLTEAQFDSQKSLTVNIELRTDNENISPVINLENPSVFVENYRINQPISSTSYQLDSRVNSNVDDPNSFIYISKKIDLTTSAKSIKVLLSAYRKKESDIRVLYKLFRDDTPDNEQVWELFPGYLNLNDGRPDTNVPESLKDEFLEYTFTADNLPQFTSFAIKVIGTSINQAYAPIIKDLRAIALR